MRFAIDGRYTVADMLVDEVPGILDGDNHYILWHHTSWPFGDGDYIRWRLRQYRWLRGLVTAERRG